MNSWKVPGLEEFEPVGLFSEDIIFGADMAQRKTVVNTALIGIPVPLSPKPEFFNRFDLNPDEFDPEELGEDAQITLYGVYDFVSDSAFFIVYDVVGHEFNSPYQANLEEKNAIVDLMTGPYGGRDAFLNHCKAVRKEDIQGLIDGAVMELYPDSDGLNINDTSLNIRDIFIQIADEAQIDDCDRKEAEVVFRELYSVNGRQQMHSATSAFLDSLDHFLQAGFSSDQVRDLTTFLWLKSYQPGMLNPYSISGFNETLANQFAFMARPENSSLDMREISDCFMKGLTIEQVKVVMTPGIGSYDRKQLVLGFEHGLTVAEVSSYANPNFKSFEFERARKKLEKSKTRTLAEQIQSASTRRVVGANSLDKSPAKESSLKR